MWVWLYATRLPAMARAQVDPDSLAHQPGVTLDNLLPPKVQWKAKNFNHLHEAPTVFYAVALSLALLGAGDGLAAMLGWAYVALRVVHSLVQAIWNKVVLRFMLFMASMLVQLALIMIAVLAAAQI